MEPNNKFPCPNCGKITHEVCTTLGDVDDEGYVIVKCPNCCDHENHEFSLTFD